MASTLPFNPDSYYLQSIDLVTPKNIVSLKAVFVEMSYYEDIFRGSVTGEVLINDSINIIDRLGMSGGEYLNLVFTKTKTTENKEKDGIKKTFRIYRVGERILHNQETENYILHFCSEEFFLSEQLKVSKAYKGKKISEMVSDVLLEQLKITKNKVDVQETKGLYDIIVPYKSPFETMHWLANYAQADTYTGADFVFYENREGFHFNSLQKLYTQVPYRAFAYTIRNAGDREDLGELYTDLLSIKSYTFLDTFDTLYGTVNGAFASRTLTVDPITRRFYETDFDYRKDYWLKNTQLNNFPVINNTPNSINKKMNEMYEATYKVVVSNKSQNKALGISKQPWSTQNNMDVETYVPYRTAQMALSHYTRIKIVVSGDPKLSVGKTIRVRIPSNRSKKDGSGLNEGLYDEYNTGVYLISAVRHIIKSDMKYDTVVEVVKDSMGGQLPDWSSSQIVNVVKGS